MLTIQVNGGHYNLNVVEEQKDEVLALLHNPPPQVHGAICAALKIGPYMPAPHRIPFALMRTQLEIMQEGKLLATFGGDLVCHSCFLNLNDQPSGTKQCPGCAATVLKNFRAINQKPKSIRPKFDKTVRWGTT